MNEISTTTTNTRRRDKPRMSTAERRQLKKKSTEQQQTNLKQIFKTAEDELDKEDNESVISDVSDTPTPTIVNNNGVLITAKKVSSLEADLARQLSEASNFVARQCVNNLKEDGAKVQKALLHVSRAHRNGILTLREKMELKDLLLAKGSDAVLARLAAFPGCASLIRNTMNSSRDTKNQAATKTMPMNRYSNASSASRYHVFRSLASYSVTMYVGEALRLEMALLNGNEHCAVRSSFVAIQPDRIAGGFHAGTKQVLQEPNAGGKSFNSEALSFETLQALFGATNLVTEMNVRYTRRHTSIVDFICDILGHRVGVSVTRAMHFLGEAHFKTEDARALLAKKLSGLDRAGENVCEEQKFDRQILHVWAQSERICELVREEFESMDRTNCNPTVCLITICDKLDKFVFDNHPELDPHKARDPLWHEEMKRRLRKEERDRVTRLLLQDIQRKFQLDSAVRRMLTSSTSSSLAERETSDRHARRPQGSWSLS